jgi:hypothetical protein
MAGQPKPAAAAPLPTHISTMKSMVADVTVPAHWHGGGWGWGGWGAGALSGAIIGGAIASSAYGYYGGSYYGYYTRPRYGYYYPRTLYYGNGPYYSGYYGAITGGRTGHTPAIVGGDDTTDESSKHFRSAEACRGEFIAIRVFDAAREVINGRWRASLS